VLKISLDNIIKAISNHSIQAVLSALVVYVAYLTIQYFKRKLFNELDNRDKFFKVKDFDLTEHPIFSRMDFLLNQINYSLEFDKGRSKLIADIVDKLYSVAKEELFEFAKEVTKKEIKGEDYNIHNLHMKYYNTITTRYMNPDNYDIDEKDEPVLKLTLNKFSKWGTNRAELMREMSEDISNTDFYTTNLAKGFAILNSHMGIFVDILHDAKATLNGINGELSGKTYKNTKIE
jgi:hypothetical protein